VVEIQCAQGEKMNLAYDPASGGQFWESISRLPGYPRDVIMPIKHMLFETGALYKVSDVLESLGAKKESPLIIVMDETPMRRGEDDLKGFSLVLLQNRGWRVKPVLMTADASGQVHTDMPHIRQVQSNLVHGCAVISVGSGVITDLTKHGCFLYQQETGEQVPFLVYQTANSVSAFTSNVAPTFIDGVKRTLDSRYPDALICDLETLRDAPLEMTVAGVGDMLAAFVSLPDWYLAYRLGMDDGYNELARLLLGPLDELLLDHARAIHQGDLAGVAMLAKIISLGGLAMSLCRATTPLSGFEHVMSHVIDLQAEIKHKPLSPHGSQVALAAVAGARMYNRFLSDFEPARVELDLCYPSEKTMCGLIERTFGDIDPSGKVSAECWADYRQKLEKWNARRRDFETALGEWSSIRQRLEQESRPAERLLQILQTVGAPLKWTQLNPPVSEEHTRFAFLHASLVRKRFTLGDLLLFMGWDREKLWNEIRE
jgi:glycerol-1-phosphate dehydrogenase [NAD(P)+]